MPDMEGFECCAKLLSIDSSKDTPVLMVTVVEGTSSIEDAFLAGATDYVIKPFYWSVLRQRIKCLIERSQLHRKLVATNEVLALII
jgi:PleD family two-component response regulator